MRRQVVTRLAALALCAAPWLTAVAKDTQLNVYNWSDYIATDTIPNFQKQTGIKVKYDNYDSDDTLQALPPASSRRSTSRRSPTSSTSIRN